MTVHVQCYLTRGTERQTVWIPKKNARIGNFVDLMTGKKPNGDKIMSRGWHVEKTYSELPTHVLEARQRDHLNHRKATDV